MLKFYFDLVSQPCRATYIILNKFKIPFEKCKIDVSKGEHRSDEYENINRFQLVPAIDDDGFKLSESVAICRYLCQKYRKNVPDSWYPQNFKDQSLVDEYLEWQHVNTRLSCAMYFQTKFLIPKMSGTEPDGQKVARFQSRMETTLDNIEDIWLKNNKFITGNNITIADIFAICELEQPSMAGYDVYKNRPKMTDWYNRVREELNPHYDEATKIVYMIRAKAGGIPPPPAKL